MSQTSNILASVVLPAFVLLQQDELSSFQKLFGTYRE